MYLYSSISKFNSITSNSDINDDSNDVELKQRVLNNISKVLKERIEDFYNILSDPPQVRNSGNFSSIAL